MRGNETGNWFWATAAVVVVVNVAWIAFVIWAIVQIVHAVQNR